MALLDLPFAIVIGVVGFISSIFLIIRFSMDYLRKSESDIKTVEMSFLHKIELGMQNVNSEMPSIPNDENGHLPIVDFVPLSKSLFSLGELIKSYTFWTTFLINARKKLNRGALFFIPTGVLIALYTGSDDFPMFSIQNVNMSVDIVITFHAFVCSLALLCLIPFVYSFIWTFYNHDKLDDEIIEARIQIGKLVSNEKSSKSSKQGRKRKNPRN